MEPTNKEKYMSRNKPYRLRNFSCDVIMTILTGGFWLIWIFVRELQNVR